MGIVFVLSAAAWITQPLLSENLIPWLDDTVIAIGAAITLFLVPVELRKREFLMEPPNSRSTPQGRLSAVFHRSNQ